MASTHLGKRIRFRCSLAEPRVHPLHAASLPDFSNQPSEVSSIMLRAFDGQGQHHLTHPCGRMHLLSVARTVDKPITKWARGPVTKIQQRQGQLTAISRQNASLNAVCLIDTVVALMSQRAGHELGSTMKNACNTTLLLHLLHAQSSPCTFTLPTLEQTRTKQSTRPNNTHVSSNPVG
jgi:hypothetical protein